MIGRLAYTGLFVIALPALLAAWAIRLDAVLSLPTYQSSGWGNAIALSGVTLMLAATRDLWVHGGGLPASPFPPKRLVVEGTYRLIAHPVYVGAVMVAAGVSLAAGSAAGLWLVTPVLALAAAAFVVGFEKDSTIRRYGRVPSPVVQLPPDTNDPPSASERGAVYLLMFLPWVILYQGVEYLGVAPDARSTYFSWDWSLPVIPWTEAIYVSTYPFVLWAPLVASRKSHLRKFAIAGLCATAMIIPVYLLLPLVAHAKPVPGDGLFQSLMMLERQHDAAVTAFPAFHVVWASLAANLYSRERPQLVWCWWLVVAALSVSCVTTGMHSVADVAAGVLAYAIVVRRATLWHWVRHLAERAANSYGETIVGPLRLINHGVYAGGAAAAGFVIAVALAGGHHLGWVTLMTLGIGVGAAVWAQLVEGSPTLLRPYGYFGGVVAVVAITTVAAAMNAQAWLLFVSVGIGSCFAQAFGRIRCLVQGCCHGRPAPPIVGIRYTHACSRVVTLSNLHSVPLHPTPVYSMVWMLLVAVVLLRLWSLAAPLPFIAGAYFVLVGLGRFVEEQFRGEPQTAIIAGLRLYQWLAITFVIAGGVVSTFEGPPAPAMASWEMHTLSAAAIAVIFYMAYGVDLPSSRRRFSRLR